MIYVQQWVLQWILCLKPRRPILFARFLVVDFISILKGRLMEVKVSASFFGRESETIVMHHLDVPMPEGVNYIWIFQKDHFESAGMVLLKTLLLVSF